MLFYLLLLFFLAFTLCFNSVKVTEWKNWPLTPVVNLDTLVTEVLSS
jgi:hypothetical protein